MCRELFGSGISQQSFALRKKIFEVDDWITTTTDRVVEVHPEVSFAALAGQPLAEPKSSWAGFQHRRHLLADAGLVLDGDLGLAGRRVAPDDVLDAAVAAWSARRVALGEHVSPARSARRTGRRSDRFHLRMRRSALRADVTVSPPAASARACGPHFSTSPLRRRGDRLQPTASGGLRPGFTEWRRWSCP